MNRTLRFLFLFLLGAGLWAGSIAVRRAVLAQQTRTAGDEEAPFILEAALQYRMTREVYESGRLEAFDPRVQYPEGVNRWRTYSIGAEFLYAPLARLLPSEWSLVSRFRWVSTVLFSLAVPLAALWAGLGWKSWWAGIGCGLILMVSPAFAVRSSGLALSRENLAFPVMMLFLVTDQLLRRNISSRMRWALLLLAGLSAGFSQVFWDFSQYLFGLWALGEILTAWKRPEYRDARRLDWISVTAGLMLASLAHPYLRGQGFLFSPVMILCMVLCLLGHKRLTALRLPALSAVFILFAVCWTLIGRVFVTNYSHFGELFWAKLVHLNQKPYDPSVLSYAQRIMWTPALNSSTWLLTKSYFPVILWALLTGVVFLFRAVKRSTDVFPRHVLLFTLVTLTMYVLFFRMHVYLILFAAASIGGMLGALARLSNIPRLGKLIAGLLLLILPGVELHRMLFFEPTNARMETADQAMMRRALEEMGLSQPRVFNRWGHPGQSYDALRSLTSALNALEVPSAPVLAGFGVSGSILADTGMPILLHPKFESPGIREKVRAFYEHLYLQTEREFRDWAVSHGARIYVHAFGSLGAENDPRETPRYMVDAVNPPAHAAVHVLERASREAVWFQPLWANERYQIFRVITDEDLEFADTLTELAFSAARRGDPDQARRLAWRVLSEYHWKHEGAMELIGILGIPRERER
ncbi:MAG: hypothetical protein JJU05_00545 [Verrucomicrobia bacterium]|nr:hypothetical protein [Verrucomicrobiota bacterium]MCH8526315.1 hypothetical protein [Kiritimatiellia bacterium]